MKTRVGLIERPKKKVRYYQAYYKIESEYVLRVPDHYFKSKNDLGIWLDADQSVGEILEWGLTENFIEVEE